MKASQGFSEAADVNAVNVEHRKCGCNDKIIDRG